MVKMNGLNQRFYLGGFDISGDVASIDDASTPVAVLEVPNLAKAGMERVRGLADGKMDFSVYFDDGTNLAHTALSSLLTTDRIALWAVGSAQGDVAAMLTAKQINYDWSRGADGAILGAVSLQGAIGVPLEWGEMFSAFDDLQASSGNTASKDDAASSADGLAAVLEIIDIDSGTPTATIEDSTDDAVWVTLKAFAAVADGAEPTAERVTVAGTVNRYLRIAWTGTFTNCQYAMAYRRGESVDQEAYA